MPSENGWEPARANAPQCEWVTIPGAEHVSLQFLKGQPLSILRAFAADFHSYIEPLRDTDSAAWTPTNSVATSNHLNGTAMDLNWNSHPFRVLNAGFDAAAIARIRDLLDFYTQDGLQIVFWGNDWNTPKDAMHWNMGYSTYGDPRVQKFIDRKIRPDGFSTFRRGSTPVVSKADGYALAIIAEGRRRGITPRGIQIALATVIVESGFKMYANSSVPASLNLPHDAVGSDHDSVGLFQQRTPMWGPPSELMDPARSAALFYARLATLPYNNMANPPGWYAAEVQRPAVEYRDRYQQNMGEAVKLYDRLAGMDAGEDDDFMSALSPDEQREIYNEIVERRSSRSPLRHVGSGWAGDMGDVTWNTDGSVHVLMVYLSAVVLGDPDAVALLREVAGVNTTRYPERKHDARLAQAMLNLIDGKVTTTSAPRTGETTGAVAAVPLPIPAAPVHVPQPSLPAVVVQEAPTAEGGLLGEITALTTQLQAVSRQVTEITEGKP